MNDDFTACGMYVFCGSQSIAHLNCGWNVKEILEMTEDMTEYNAYHFKKNYPNIPIYKPSEWSQNSFLNTLKGKQYKLLYANNPCSGLSSINKNANVNQPINNRFFEVFNVIDKIEPESFLIENAPTLVTIGTPILHKMVDLLSNKYKFTIIRDMAGNHGVAMKRLRTMIIGWNKKSFNNRIPLIHMNIEPKVALKDVLGTIDNNALNADDENYNLFNNVSELYKNIPYGKTILYECCKEFDTIKDKLTSTQLKSVTTLKNKLDNNLHGWDKSPFKPDPNKQAPSITSLTRLIHPIENRNLYIREYARIMGYPDDFKFYEKSNDEDSCKCSSIQCIAQGVPVKFIEWISKEIKRCFENNYKIIGEENIDVVFQQHTYKRCFKFTKDEFFNTSILNNVNKDYIPLNQ